GVGAVVTGLRKRVPSATTRALTSKRSPANGEYGSERKIPPGYHSASPESVPCGTSSSRPAAVPATSELRGGSVSTGPRAAPGTDTCQILTVPWPWRGEAPVNCSSQTWPGRADGAK